MELVYLWVKEFRNIVNQGFNISSKHLFQYNSNTNILSIKENPKYIPNFFGSKISNVTGIVGQNAAGKTNLLELIMYVLDGGNTKISNPFFVIYENQGDLVCYTQQFANSPICETKMKFLLYSSNSKLPESVYFSNTFDGRNNNFGKKTHNLSLNQILQSQFGQNIYTKIKEETRNQINFINSNEFLELIGVEKETNPSSQFSLMPNRVSISTPSWNNINSRANVFDKNVARILKLQHYDELSLFCRRFREKITANKSGNALKYYTAFLLYLDFIFNEFSERHIGYQQELTEGVFSQLNSKTGKRFDSSIQSLMLDKLNESSIDEIFMTITFRISEYIRREFSESFEKERFLEYLGSSAFKDISIFFEGTYSNRRMIFVSDYDDVMESFIKQYLEASTNQNLSFTFDWQGISSGHKAFLNLFSRFHSIRDKIKGNQIIICIDEGDLYFHPKWQTEFLNKLITVIPKIFKDQKIQFILTTHSPFLISDLPKDNLIFLEKRKEGECRVIPNEKIDGETFGGNIGELYLDAFFLNGSLISYFAAKKIKELISHVKNQKEYSETDMKLLKFLGNKIIKQRIEFLHNDKDR